MVVVVVVVALAVVIVVVVVVIKWQVDMFCGWTGEIVGDESNIPETVSAVDGEGLEKGHVSTDSLGYSADSECSMVGYEEWLVVGRRMN